MPRFLIFAAGLVGAAGVALLALAAHAGGDNLRIAASFMLFHAPALLAIGLLGEAGQPRRVFPVAGLIMLAGVVIFCADLCLRDLVGERLFAMAAPTGGTLTILGWLGVAVAAILPKAKN